MDIHDLYRLIKTGVGAADDIEDELAKNGDKYLSPVELFEFKNESGCITGKLLNIHNKLIEKMDKG